MIPKRFLAQLGWLQLSNLLVLVVNWVLQVTGTRVGVVRPVRPLGILVGMSLLTLGSLALPKLLAPWLTSDRGTHLQLDLTVALLGYDLLLLWLPTAYVLPQAGPGLLFGLVALPMPYLPPNGVWGIRLPVTRASVTNWTRTNTVGARALLIVGLLLQVVAGGSQRLLGPATLLLGGLYVGGIIWYAYHL